MVCVTTLACVRVCVRARIGVREKKKDYPIG